MKKKTIFKIVGASLAGIILIIAIAGFIYYKTTISPMLSIMKNGHPTIYNSNTLDIYYCKNEVEEVSVVSKIINDTYDYSSEQNTNAIVQKALAPEQTLDSATLDTWYLVFTFYTSLNSIEPGYYVVYSKDKFSFSILYLQYDKKLLKKYGKSKDAVSFEKSWTKDFSI